MAKNTKSSPAGVCRFCGCTDDNCIGCIQAMGHPCSWVDRSRTVCSNPECVAKWKKRKAVQR